MSGYKEGDRVAIPVAVTDVWDGHERKLPHREGPQIEWDFASGIEAGDPYVTSGVADLSVVRPWPDAERMARLEALLREAWGIAPYGLHRRISAELGIEPVSREVGYS